MCGEKKRKTRKEKKRLGKHMLGGDGGGGGEGKQDMSNTKGDDEQSLLPLSPSSLPLLLFMFGREGGRQVVGLCVRSSLSEKGLCAYPAWLLLLFRTVYCVFSRRMLPPQSDVWLYVAAPFFRDCGIWRGIFFANHSNSNSSVQYTGEK